jgi:hypothetical protein
VLDKGEIYDFDDEALSIKVNEHRRWFEKEFSVHNANYVMNVLYKDLGKNTIIIATGKHGDVWMIGGNPGLKRLRGCFHSGEYKEELRWWIWPARILSTLVGIATIIGVVDALRVPALNDRIHQLELQIKILTEYRAKDSTTNDSLRYLLENL